MKYHPVSILLLLLSLLLLLVLLEGARASTGLCVDVISSHVVSYAELSRIVHVRRGGGAPYVAPRSPNPPTGRRRDSPISSSLFSHGPPVCAVA